MELTLNKHSYSGNIQSLIGAKVTNENGGEFLIKGISMDLREHEILIDIVNGENKCSVEWSTISKWSIQFPEGELQGKFHDS